MMLYFVKNNARGCQTRLGKDQRCLQSTIPMQHNNGSNKSGIGSHHTILHSFHQSILPPKAGTVSPIEISFRPRNFPIYCLWRQSVLFALLTGAGPSSWNMNRQSRFISHSHIWKVPDKSHSTQWEYRVPSISTNKRSSQQGQSSFFFHKYFWQCLVERCHAYDATINNDKSYSWQYL